MKHQFRSEEAHVSAEEKDTDYMEILKHLSLEVQKLGPANGMPPKRFLHLTKRINRLKKDLEVVIL